MTKTKIEWADEVWNPVTGCSKVSQGCKHCYAETIANRFWVNGRKFSDVQCHEERLLVPFNWNKPRRVFVNSMSDLFHDDVPNDFIYAVLNVARNLPQHTFMILTKRPERMREFVFSYGPYDRETLAGAKNIWLGVSVEDQGTADKRIPVLLQTPAAVRFVSYEPALGPVDFGNFLCETYTKGGLTLGRYLDWIIMGGESGPGARLMHPDWVRSVRNQCQEVGIPFFFKQWGEFCSFEQLPEDGKGLKDTPYEPIDLGGCTVYRVGKKAAGRLLDGRTWDEYPGGKD
jgi:protein gp37